MKSSFSFRGSPQNAHRFPVPAGTRTGRPGGRLPALPSGRMPRSLGVPSSLHHTPPPKSKRQRVFDEIRGYRTLKPVQAIALHVVVCVVVGIALSTLFVLLVVVRR